MCEFFYVQSRVFLYIFGVFMEHTIQRWDFMGYQETLGFFTGYKCLVGFCSITIFRGYIFVATSLHHFVALLSFTLGFINFFKKLPILTLKLNHLRGVNPYSGGENPP